MNDPDQMQAMLDQNDYLRQQLHALAKGTTKRRRRFLLAVLRCVRCGDVLLEVVDLVPYPVVRHRRTEVHPGAGAFPDHGSVQEITAYFKAAGELIRQGEWVFYPIPSPVPPVGDAEMTIRTACRCRQVNLTEAEVFAAVHAPQVVTVVH